MTFAGTGRSRADVDGSTVHQCSMIHGLDPNTAVKLNSLDNKVTISHSYMFIIYIILFVPYIAVYEHIKSMILNVLLLNYQ